MVLMNSWNIEQYGASDGDDFDAKMNYFKHIRWFHELLVYKTLTVPELEMILLLT